MEKKTECGIVQDLLLGYVDKVLNEESKRLVEEHLARCAGCQKRLEEIKGDMKENEENQQQEIDYLKKIRRNSRIKSIIIAIGIILAVCLIVFLYKFIKISSIINKAEQSLEANNWYKEVRQELENNEVSISKIYYKDGKYKATWEIYSDAGVELKYTNYATVDSDERIAITGTEKKATIEKGDIIQIYNQEDSVKAVPFIQMENLFSKLGKAFLMSMDTYDHKYYVIRNQFETPQRWEIWLDKETGLPVKQINREGEKTFFAGTDIVKKVNDFTQEFKYAFGTVTDEDVKAPDLSEYEVEHKNRNFEDIINQE